MTTTTPTAATDPAGPPVEEVRRRVAKRRESDVIAVVGAAAAAAALTWLLFTQIAPFSGLLGWIVVAATIFLGIYALVVSFDESGQVVRDRLMSAVIHAMAGLLLLVLVFVIGYVLVRGATAMVHLNFYTQDISRTGPLDPLTSGGVLHGVVGTLIEITLALLITVPLGLMCAVFLSEFPGRYARLVRTFVEAMTALPSIVAGLFIYSTVILSIRPGRDGLLEKGGLAAALALSVMMFPIIIRAADVVLRLVPGSLTEASLALGASRWRTVWCVTLPSARSGLATAVILGTARGIGETSPVLLTAGYGAGMNKDPRSGPMVSLPLLAYQLRQSPQPAMISRAFGAASLLMVLVLLLFVLARWLGGRGPGVLSQSQQRRRARQSYADAVRIAEAVAERVTRRRSADVSVASAAVPSAADPQPSAYPPAAAPSVSDSAAVPGKPDPWAPPETGVDR